MIYVINRNVDSNNNFYPNYYYDTLKDGTIIYYNTYLEIIDKSKYKEFNIDEEDDKNINEQTGSGKPEVLNKVLVKEQATLWTNITDILRPMTLQPFNKTKKENASRVTNFSKLLGDKRLLFKYGNAYYQFDLSKDCLKEVAKEIVCSTGKSMRKVYYNDKGVVNCLNIFCIRPCHFDKQINQRQECTSCENWRTGKKKTVPLGWFFEKRLRGSYVNNNIPIYLITATRKDVKLTYTSMCHNNYSESYWDNLPYKINGDKRSDKKIFTYIVKDKNAPINTPIVYKPIKIDGNEYFCELRRPYNSYGKGIIEIDHIDGNHHHNTLDNIQPLCKICHGIKTDKQQDKGSDSDTTIAIAKYVLSFKDDNYLKNVNKLVKKNIEDQVFIKNADNTIDSYSKIYIEKLLNGDGIEEDEEEKKEEDEGDEDEEDEGDDE